MTNPGRSSGERPRGFWLWRAAIGAAIALGLFILAQHALASRPAASKALSIQRAEALYVEHCQACHGTAMEGTATGGEVPPAPLVKSTFRILFGLMPSAMEGWIASQIAEGGNGMPPFGAQLSAQDRADLATLIDERN